VFGHFGSAPVFIIVDSETGDFGATLNPEVDHVHGQCQPLNALNGQPVDAVVVGGIGGGALRKLNASGIKTFRAVEGTVGDNLDLIKSGKLPEFSPFQTCGTHGPKGNCGHH
jgi:predicted Fe-Mo cluster-binding NifX family protein